MQPSCTMHSAAHSEALAAVVDKITSPVSFKLVVKRRAGKSLGCVGRFDVKTTAKFAPPSAKLLESGKGVRSNSLSLVTDDVVGVAEVRSNDVSVDELDAPAEVVPLMPGVLSVSGALVVRASFVLL